MDLDQRAELIAQYEDGYQMIVDALEGITDAEMDARPAPNEWSAREVVHHLADSEMTSAIRLRLLVAADGPTILGYDQAEFARRLHYDRPITASLEAFKAARRSTAEILHRMTDAEWAARGDAHRYRPLHRRGVAGNLREPRHRPCGANPHGADVRAVA